MDADHLSHAALQALQATFGFPAFRGNQEAAVLAALQGRDSFVLMPTGGGKSICYSLPPLVKPGLVVVVSPLIALMQDQVTSLQARGVRADYLASTRSEGERQALLRDLRLVRPTTQLLFATPELLASDSFLPVLRGLHASGALLLVAVDEAHCISGWGHDFRGAYRRLWRVRHEVPGCPLMALTATASARVQADIVSQLRLHHPLVLRASFNRPEIAFLVRYLDLMGGSGDDPLPHVVALLDQAAAQQQQQVQQPGATSSSSPAGSRPAGIKPGQPPCTVIYCLKRETCDRVSAALRRRGIAAAAYHAGLPDRERSSVLLGWQARQLAVVCGTTAFGMGIDRSDVRFVIHFNPPKSLEGYYQESGRAARDGAPAQSIVYFSTADRQQQEWVLAREQQKQQERRQQQGDGGPAAADEDPPPTQLQQFAEVVELCMAPQCRRAGLLRHFGEQLAPGSGGLGKCCCDVCEDSQGVRAALAQLATAGAQRQQRYAGGKHTLDFGGRAAAASRGQLEFETARPGEGLDFDAKDGGPSRALEDSDAEDSIEDSEDEEEQAAAAALKRARVERAPSGSAGSAAGTDAMLAAMERAERAQQQAASTTQGGSRERLMHKLDAGGASAAAATATAPQSSAIPQSARDRATHQLAQVLCGNLLLAGAGGERAQGLAEALEQQCAAGGASKTVWQSKVSNMVLALRKARSVGEVPALAELLGSHFSGSSSATADPACSAAALAEQVAAAVQQAGGVPEQGQGSKACQQVVSLLQQLSAVPVTVELLQQTGAGKKLRRLSRHPCSAVAGAAAAAVASWKARLQV